MKEIKVEDSFICEVCGKRKFSSFQSGICMDCKRELDMEKLSMNNDDNEIGLVCDCGRPIVEQYEIEDGACEQCIQNYDRQMIEEQEHPDQKANEGKRLGG